MNKLDSLNELLDLKSQRKSRFSTCLDAVGYLIWLHVIIRKKSHRVRIATAMRVFKTLQRDDFRLAPYRLFAYIRTIDPFVFEELLLIAFKKRGIKVIHNKRYTGDGGIDGMIILPSKQRIALQAKRYQKHINVQHIRDFSESIRAHGCHGGYFIHCGKSGQEVYKQLSDDITLISGNNLHRLLTDL